MLFSGGNGEVWSSVRWPADGQRVFACLQKDKSSRSGFSLFELLVVVLIISLSLGLFLGFNYRQQESIQLQAQAHAVGQLLRAAKSTAIVQGESNACLYDPQENTLRTSLKERSKRLSENTFLLVNDRRVDQETQIAVFYAHGAAVAEKIAVTSKDGEQTVIIRIDPLFGDISFADK